MVDTGAVLELASSSGRRHKDVLAVVEALDGPFVLSPFVLAELDYMLIERHGQEQQLALLSEVADGAYELAEFGREDVEAAAVVRRRIRAQLAVDDLAIALRKRRRREHVREIDDGQ